MGWDWKSKDKGKNRAGFCGLPPYPTAGQDGHPAQEMKIRYVNRFTSESALKWMDCSIEATTSNRLFGRMAEFDL